MEQDQFTNKADADALVDVQHAPQEICEKDHEVVLKEGSGDMEEEVDADGLPPHPITDTGESSKDVAETKDQEEHSDKDTTIQEQTLPDQVEDLITVKNDELINQNDISDQNEEISKPDLEQNKAAEELKLTEVDIIN